MTLEDIFLKLTSDEPTRLRNKKKAAKAETAAENTKEEGEE
jgi:hypothetical protein